MTLPPPLYLDPDTYASRYTADQMRAYGAACAAAERQRCIDLVALFGGSVEIDAAIRGEHE